MGLYPIIIRSTRIIGSCSNLDGAHISGTISRERLLHYLSAKRRIGIWFSHSDYWLLQKRTYAAKKIGQT